MTDRAVSVSVNYSFTLIIATVLIGGLLMAAGGLIDSQARSATHDELDVLGQKFSANLMTADRMVAVADADNETVDGSAVEIVVRTRLPSRVGGSTYLIDVNESPDELRLYTRDEEDEVFVSFDSNTTIQSTTVAGGTIEIRYDAGAERLEVTNP